MLSLFVKKASCSVFVANFLTNFSNLSRHKSRFLVPIMPPKRKAVPKAPVSQPEVGNGPSPPKSKKNEKQSAAEITKEDVPLPAKRAAAKKAEAAIQASEEPRPKRGAAKKPENVEKKQAEAKPKAAAKKDKKPAAKKASPTIPKEEKPKKSKKEAAPAEEAAVEKNVTKRGVRSELKSATDEPNEAPVKKSGRGAKKAEPAEDESKKKELPKKGKAAEKAEKPVAKSKSGTEKKPSKETNGEAPKLLNDSVTKWESINFSCDKNNAKGEPYNLKITSWNVAGVRAWLKKDGMNIFKYDSPDILCLQELQCSEEKLPNELKEVEGYKCYRVASEQEGYAGVAVYSKIMPIEVKYGIGDENFDNEGRCITAEYEKFYLVNVYVPNAGRGLKTLDKRMDWNDVFKNYVKCLDKQKPVILCGDLNVAHEEIDLANPKSNQKNAGFTPQEREGMTEFLKDGYIDTFREINPDKTGAYTFWSYMGKARSKNVGWRLDYFIVSSQIMDNVCDSVIRDQVLGSDHCPLSLFINI